METIFMWGLGIFVLWIYLKTSYYFYKKHKITDTGFIKGLTHLLLRVVLFIFPYLFLLGELGLYLNDGKTHRLKFWGKYLWGTVYVLGLFAVLLAFCLTFLIIISLIIKWLSALLEDR